MSAAEMREALKPCPFCGGEAELYESGTVAGVICERDNSHSVVVSRSKDASGEAVSAWNRRALPLPDEEGMVERVARALCESAVGGRCACSGGFSCADEYPGRQARAAIRAINGGEP